MPVFSIVLKAEQCEGVAAVRPSEGRYWALKCRCIACDQTTAKDLLIDSSEVYSSKSGGGVCNCSSKCRFCKGTMTANVLDGATNLGVCHRSGDCSGPSFGTYSPDQHPEGGVVVQLDMRGSEPMELRLDNQWEVEGTSGEVFKDVDLSADWYDYDEKAGSTVSISGVSVSFHRVKR